MAELTRLKSATSGDVAELQQRVTQLKDKLTAADEERAATGAKVTTLEAQLREWKNTADGHSNTVADLQRQLRESQHALQRCEAHGSTSEGRLTELTAALESSRQRVAALQMQVDKLEAERDALSADLQKTRAGLADAQAEAARSASRCALLEKEARSGETALKSLQAERVAQEKQLTDVNASNRTLTERVAALEHEAARRDQLTKADSDRWQKQLADQGAEVVKRDARIEALCAELDAKRLQFEESELKFQQVCVSLSLSLPLSFSTLPRLLIHLLYRRLHSSRSG